MSAKSEEELQEEAEETSDRRELYLREGRTLSVEQTGGDDLVEIRSASGQVEVRIRRTEPDLRTGAYRTLPAPDGAWAWQRGDGIVVAVNLGSAEATITGVDGRIALGTDRTRGGEDVGGELRLRPAEAAVIRSAG